MRLMNQFGKFAVAGGIAAAANFFSRFIFNRYLSYVPSITLAFLVGLATGFLLMRAYVFTTGTHKPAKQAYLYVLINLVGLVLTIVVSVTVAKLARIVLPNTEFDEAIGHLIGVGSPILLSFYAHKKLTFA